MKTRTFAVALAAMLVLGMTGVTAYTTATADRDVSVNVVNDKNGVILIQDGNTDGASFTNGKLVVDADGESLNRDAVFTFGDEQNPETTHAFKITNNDNTAHTYTLNSTDVSSVTYEVAVDTNGDGTVDTTNTVSSTGSTSFGLDGTGSTDGSGVAYVVVKVDTPDATGTESGTLRIKAN